jgi:quercetin dioxygenase-like cupin family protein
MLSFQLDTLASKELFKNVLVRLIKGDKLALNYFELKSGDVEIPVHNHPVEHLVVVLNGEMEFFFEDQTVRLKEKKGLFLPAETHHSARVIRAPVKALEIFPIAEDEYYKET